MDKQTVGQGKQVLRQQARSRARAARAKVRQELADRQRRLARLGEQVAVVLADRDATIVDHERRAGDALRTMIQEEGLTATETLGWCGVEGLTARQVRRLARPAPQGGKGDDQSSPPDTFDGQHAQTRRDGGPTDPWAAWSIGTH